MKGLAQTAITELKGVGAKAAEKLAKLAIVSVKIYCFTYPIDTKTALVFILCQIYNRTYIPVFKVK